MQFIVNGDAVVLERSPGDSMLISLQEADEILSNRFRMAVYLARHHNPQIRAKRIEQLKDELKRLVEWETKNVESHS